MSTILVLYGGGGNGKSELVATLSSAQWAPWTPARCIGAR